MRQFVKAILALAIPFLLIGPAIAAPPRAALWDEVRAAMTNGLPKTAITNLDLILDGALRDKSYPEAAHAMAQKIALQSQSENDPDAAKIIHLEAALTNAPVRMAPILHTILAHWYWQYFDAHRWQFAQRTATQSAPGADFTTWDLSRLFDEIERQFQTTLAGAILKITPVAAWSDLLEKGNMSDAARPTLYDFIAREALDFYAQESEPRTPEDKFEISANDPVFDSNGQFLQWQPRATDTNSPELKAIQLWQDLLRFHQADPPPAPAFAQADLDRLVWASRAVSGENVTARYTNALQAFIRQHRHSEISSLARYSEAWQLFVDGDPTTAHRIALKAVRRFRKSPGAKLCQNLLTEIEAKSAQISTERIWNAPWPRITVTYRNIDSIYFRAIPVNWEMFLDRRHNRPENLSEDERSEILGMKSALEWSGHLPRRRDYKETNFDLSVPTKLKPGFYFLAATHKSGHAQDSEVSLTPIWVSDLSLVLRTRGLNIEGFVTKANSGDPIAGAEVSVWHLDSHGDRVADPALTTDADGFFAMKPKENESCLFLARYHGQEIANENDMYRDNSRRPPNAGSVAVFYTDRAIYRPGQIIQYSGICFKTDRGGNHYQILTNREVTVIFKDANNKEIARQRVPANDYGSFSGSFTAPRDRLLGEMSIRAGGLLGGTTIRVEEYKRPKFQVTLDPPKSPPRLNTRANLIGHAISYTGTPVDGANLTYRVVRQSRLPVWGWAPFIGRPDREIAHGSAKTAADGSFEISFDATPDPSIPETNSPIFDFTVNADVTDNAGETRSDERIVHVGYAALQASLTADDWQTSAHGVQLTATTQSLDDEPQPAEGEIKIYALRSPSKIERAPLNQQPPAQVDWPLRKIIAHKPFSTGANGKTQIVFALPVGIYRAILKTVDRFGEAVTAEREIRVLDPTAAKLDLKIPSLFAAPQWESQPGDEFAALWGTGYAHGRACIEIEHRNEIIKRYWTDPRHTQEQIHLAITEALRGGFTLHVTQVRENRAYLLFQKVEVPWKNKELQIKWEHFTSKLQPGQKESWTAVITGPKAEPAAAEMVATLYDESLDAFTPLDWFNINRIFGDDESSMQSLFCNSTQSASLDFSRSSPTPLDVPIIYRHFPDGLVAQQAEATQYGPIFTVNGVGYINTTIVGAMPSALSFGGARDRSGRFMMSQMQNAEAGAVPVAMGGAPAKIAHMDLGQVTARKNLNETAFFYPQLRSDSNGVVRMTFTMAEALTRWHLIGMAHDKSLRSGLIEAHAVTAKDLMVQPNPPRFLREDDTVEFTVKVSNQSDAPQTGTVRLTFNYAITDKSADADLGNTATEQPFDVPARESRAFSWRIHVPDGCGFLTYKAVGATDKLSDGEEGAIPVLPRRELVTESLPLWVTGPATNHFRFDKLLDSAASPTLQNQSLTVQMVSNPAWYAVLALPYLMEFPHECAEQRFDRFYANALARHIAGSDPKIRRIFDLWRNSPALDSPLEKNQDLKSVMIEETPWLRDAQSESQSRRNIGILFDSNRLDYETDAVLQKLLDTRLSDGRWPWFTGGPGDDYITLYILTGFGRLRHLHAGVKVPDLRPSIFTMDDWASENYRRIQKGPHPDDYVPNPTDALFLYCRAFFIKDIPVNDKNTNAVDFLLRQSRRFWLRNDCLQSQAQTALALHRWGGAENISTALSIMKSLKERSASSDELGMHWPTDQPAWLWYYAPIETQALMIEAFDEIMNDDASVQACRLWLLKQKQTQNWPTTKSTADAIYALLLRGTNLLSSDVLVRAKLGGIDITPSTAEAGDGFYERRFTEQEIKPALGDITVEKSDAGAAWGGVHWQYLEDIAHITPHAGTPFSLKKTLYVSVNTKTGRVLRPVDGPLRVGDELVVRLELRADRDLQYIHLKDERGSGAEPVNVLSQYKYQDGLGYYESTRDTATHFFFDYLPRGTYVFEYSLRLQLRGTYEAGLAEIECMYAPEFNSHSQSIPLVIQ